MLLVVAYLTFACSFGYGFVLEFVVEDTRGKEVVLVRWHCSTTSLKTTSHGPFFPPVLFWPGCRMLLNCWKEVLPFAFSLRADGGAIFCLRGRVWRYIIMGRSSTRSLDDVGTASCFTVFSLRYGSRPSYQSLYSLTYLICTAKLSNGSR